MRIALFCALLVVPGTVAAESLCDVGGGIIPRLAGVWDGTVAMSVETEALSVTDEGLPVLSVLFDDGRFGTAWMQDIVGAGETVTLSRSDGTYDVDGVDDLLETAEADWMADALSDTPCGPEALPQLRGAVDYAPDLTGDLTLIAYFDDRILMLAELEYRGDWGVAFVIAAALLEPGPLPD